MTSSKMDAGAMFPGMTWSALRGDRIAPSADEGWRMLVVYRGSHCPLCRQYLGALNRKLDAFEALGVKVYTVSADPRDRAEAEAAEEGWRFPVGYDLQPEQMKALGLYVSDPVSPAETDRPFAEPGLFVINPRGETHVVAVANSPLARPDLPILLAGLKFVIEHDHPVRGRAD